MNSAEMFEIYESALAVAIPEAKAIKQSMRCPVHHKKSISMLCDYDQEGTCAHLSKCCCPEFAQMVAKALEDAQLFDHVRVED